MKRPLAAVLFTLLTLLAVTADSRADEDRRETASLIAHWKLDEGSGTTINDSSGSGYHGVASVDSWSTDRPPVPGAGSHSFAFAGDAYIDTADFDINDDFSIAVWVKPSEDTAEAILGKHTDAGANQLLFGIYDGDYILNIRDDVQRTSPLRRDAWQHLLLVGRAADGKTTVSVYRNGIPLWTFEHEQVLGDLSGGKPWTIGRDWDPTEANDYFSGLMADLRIYDGALSDAEIAALTAGFAGTCTVPSASYPRLNMAIMARCEIIELLAGEHEVYESDVNDGLIMRGAGREQTILTLWMDSNRFLSLNRHTTISDLTFRGRGGYGFSLIGGGALTIEEGVKVTLEDVAFEDNYASYDGGAIRNDGDLTILNSRFVGNMGGGYLGRISRGGAIANFDTLQVKNSQFETNFVFNDFNSGGAISSLGTLRVEDSAFHKNNADNGGAIQANGRTEIVNTSLTANRATFGTAVNSVGELTLINSVLENNEAYSVPRASGTVLAAGTALIVDTRISGNSARNGAAVDNRGGEGGREGSMTITRSVLNGNSAAEGAGAISNNGRLFVIDSTISGNSAVNYAGAIHNRPTAVVEIDNTTISGSTLVDSVWAQAVSAIYNQGEMKISNSTISGSNTTQSIAEPAAVVQDLDDASLALIHTTIAANERQTPGRGFGMHILKGSVSVLNTLATDNGAANCLMNAQAPYAGSGNLAGDESCDQFTFSNNLAVGPLAGNGGPTETHAIGENSDARDAGNAAWCTAADQRGVARDAACDVGAYEYESSPGLFLPLVMAK